jgi:hypothetical protein
MSGKRMVVGAPYDDTGATEAGAAHVYDLGSTTPAAPAATFYNPAPGAQDYFGYSVAISGTRVVVGAYQDGAGRAYVYNLTSATPTVPVFTLNNPVAGGSRFGLSVAISGTRVVVGAAWNVVTGFPGVAEAGVAYVYDVGSGTPTVPIATLNNPTPGAGDHFGTSVSISGTRVLVGTPEDEGVGKAYLYDIGSATPTMPVATLNNPTPAANDWFGYSVAISGTRVAVAAPNDSFQSGSVYVFDVGSVTPTTPVATLSNPTPADLDNFGKSVALSGTRVVVGSDGDDIGATNAGSAYVYDMGSATPTIPIATLNNPGPAVDDSFGYSVAISGTRVVVGANIRAAPSFFLGQSALLLAHSRANRPR